MPCLAFFDWFLQTQQKQIRPIIKAKKTRLAVMAPMITVHWLGERGWFTDQWSSGSSNVKITVFSCTPPLFSATQRYVPKKEVKREHIRLNLTKLVIKVAWFYANISFMVIPKPSLNIRTASVIFWIYLSIFTDYFSKVHSFCKQCLHKDLVFINW